MAGSEDGALVLSDGTIFEGDVYASSKNTASKNNMSKNPVSGEVVFNTVLSGYQEVLTDPSYAGQIITFTYPHIGNYGVSSNDAESNGTFCRGVIVRDMQLDYSNWQAEMGLMDYFFQEGLSVISGIDTRRLTQHIREAGAMSGAFGINDEKTLLKAASDEPGTNNIDLVEQVTCDVPYFFGDEKSEFKIVALDYGIKKSILNQLAEFAHVEVLPASTSTSEILGKKPDGVFLSNGPGDPQCVPYAAECVKGLLGEIPIFGICLGFQILSQALGAKTYKLAFGHHGGNHPVMNLSTKEVEITSQNHNFAVEPDSLDSSIEITHINLNDQTLEGIYASKLRAKGIQYHPEAGPGPHDSRYLFQDFQELLSEKTNAR